MSDQTVLVVEDEAAIRELIVRILDTEGIQAHEAENAEVALQRLRTQRYGLVLLDLHMPGDFNGEEFLFRVRDEGDNIPIIIVSGWVDEDITEHHPDAVYAVIKKPINSAQLLERVREVLSEDPLADL